MARRLEILFEKRGQVVSLPPKHILDSEISKQVSEYLESLKPPEDEVVEPEVTQDDYTTYVFKHNEEGVFETNDGSSYNVAVGTPYLNTKLDYRSLYQEHLDSSTGKLYRFKNALDNFYYIATVTNHSSRRIDAPDEIISLVYQSFIRNKGHFSYRNRRGLYMVANFKGDSPNTATKQKIFQQKLTQKITNSLLNSKSNRNQLHPNLNNVYESLSLCWGNARYGQILVSSDDIVQATSSLMTTFLTSVYNSDLSSTFKSNAKVMYLALKRSCNAPSTMLTDSEHSELKQALLDVIEPVALGEDAERIRNFHHTVAIMLGSALNIDVQDFTI